MLKFLRSPGSRRLLALLGIGVAGGLGTVYSLLPPPPPPKLGVPALRVAGVLVPPKGDIVANTLDLVRRYAAGEVTLELPDGSSRKLHRGRLGAEIDRSRLSAFVRESQRPGSAAWRAWASSAAAAKGEPLDVPLPVRLEGTTAIDALLDVKGTLDVPATDAFVNLETRKLEPEKPGHNLDVYGTIARLEAAFRDGQDKVQAAVEVIAPKLHAKDLGDVKFDQVLGYFETRYSEGGKAKDRAYNLHLAASKLDGAVVLPGAIFDFNETVGPRDEAHGYRVATVIAQGELVDGIGGGTCQISGTLHGAAFFAGLEIVERFPHTRPSFYIKLGLDATVVYPSINFRFRNPFGFPIVLHETVTGGVVRAEILGPERKHTVTFFRRIDEVIPFEEVERPSAKIPEGTRVLVQRGIPGFKTTSSRVVREGAYASRTRWTDSYPPTAQILSVGTAPRNTEPLLKDDPHPEYVVDEYLVVTQGPDIRTPGSSSSEPGGGTVEAREPGKTGAYGWTEKAGFSKFHSKNDAEGDDAPPAEGERADKNSKRDGAKRDKERTPSEDRGGKPGTKEKDKAKASKGSKKRGA